MSKRSLVAFVVLCCRVLAQTSVLSVGADGRLPVQSFAQGEVTTIVLRSPKPVPDAAVPKGQRWPESLGGIRVTFSNSLDSGPGVAARIGSIRSVPFPDPRVTATFILVEIQVPFSIGITLANEWLPPFHMKTFLGSEEIDSRVVVTVADRISLARCGTVSFPIQIFGGLDQCGIRLFREDGTEINSSSSVVAPGSKLHVFAYGLGQTEPATGDGEPFQENAAPVLRPFYRLWIEYRANAAPRFAFDDEVTRINSPVISAVPGSVGVYRIDFEVPQTPEVVLGRCNPDASLGGVLSNATLTVRGGASLGGGGLCIAPNEKPDAPPRRFP